VWQSFDSIELTREEDGLGICAGAWLTHGRPMMVIQSTGLGNMITALASLNLASAIPIPILASFRGFYKEGIESQIPLGQHLPAILAGLGIRYTVIDEKEKLAMLAHVIQDAYAHCRPHVALVSPKVWEGSKVTAWQDSPPWVIQPRPGRGVLPCTPILQPHLTRYQAIEAVAQVLDQQIVVANLGIPSKELYAVCDRPLNYYMLGSMGLAASIGFGMSRFSQRKVMVLEGDGSLLMNPNSLITIGQNQPRNLMILALDNACYGSTGSQNTYTRKGFDLECFARSCGFDTTARVNDAQQLTEAIAAFEKKEGLSLIHVVLKPGNSGCATIPLSPETLTRRFRASLER
jgi:sulfopyruvate decarboxylase subunit beta